VSFVEVADRVWVARQEWLDLNVVVVAGGDGLALVDPTGSARTAAAVLDDVRRLGAGDVVAVVNTHEHFDHTFGNGAVRAAYAGVPIHAHEVAASRTLASGERFKRLFSADPDDPYAPDVLATEVVPADHTFSSVAVVDLGDRRLELLHPGRGHTAGDLVIQVPDADVLLAGDLVEESGPPAYGEDSHPLDWPQTLDLVLGLLTPATTVVPGHGARVGHRFVLEQHADVSGVAATIRRLAEEGVPVEEALDAGEWPFPAESLATAVRRGYAALSPATGRRLPLV